MARKKVARTQRAPARPPAIRASRADSLEVKVAKAKAAMMTISKVPSAVITDHVA